MKAELKKLNTLRNKYIKAYNQLFRFNRTIVNTFDNEDIRHTSEFFDCEITLMDMLENKITIIENRIEEIQACNLTSLGSEI